jgi:hypothetical protein
MKYLLLVSFSLFLAVNNSSAQTAALNIENLEEAKKVAEASDNIEIWECKKSGNITFVKSVSNNSGKAQFVQVYFDEKTKSFSSTQETPKCSAAKQKASCTPKEEESCQTSDKKATTALVPSNKSKTCSKGSSSSCCASKKTSN